jgi:hypothetical protein
MGLLDKVAAARGAKSWSEPPFWSTNHRRFLSSGLSPDREQIENDFEAYIDLAYKGDGPVFSAIADRQRIFSQATFAWRQFRNGQGGDLFTNDELHLLQLPAPNTTTGELLSRMDVTASLAGNFYATTADDDGKWGRAATGQGRRIAYLRPDWVTIIVGSKNDDPNAIDAKVVGYEYRPRTTVLSAQSDPVTAAERGVSLLAPA